MHSIENTDYKQLLSFIMHDLRHINAMIRDSSRLVALATRGNRLDEEALRHHAAVVVEQAAALSAWLAIADMYIDPDRFEKEPLQRIPIHEIFYKAIANFKRLAAKKKIKVDLYGRGKFYLDAHPVIDIMPYLLLDNAIKYSPTSGKVEITLDETSSNVSVEIQSMGPRLEEDEHQSLCVVGFRGRHARKQTELGTGQGLALLKTICNYHGGSLDIRSSGPEVSIGGIPYSLFTVSIRFPKAASV